MKQRSPVFFLGVAAGLLGIIGTFGTWVKAASAAGEHASFKGFDANAGKSVFAGCLIAVLLLALASSRGSRWPSIVALIPAGIAGAIAGWYFASPAKFVTGAVSVSRGWGLYLAAIGSIVLFVICLVHAAQQRRAVVAAPPSTP